MIPAKLNQPRLKLSNQVKGKYTYPELADAWRILGPRKSIVPLIAGLAEVRGKLLERAGSLAPSQQDEVFLGTWSVKDLLAHLIGWDFTNLEAAKALLDGRLPAFYDYHDKDWQGYNTQLVAQYKQEVYEDLLTAVTDSHEKLIHFLKGIPAEEFNNDRGIRFRGYKVTIARLLQAEMDDEEVHFKQVETFRPMQLVRDVF